MSKLVYFAHPITHYGKRIERICEEKIRVEGLEHFDFDEIEVFNPNQTWLDRLYTNRKAEKHKKPFEIFQEITNICDGTVGVTFGDEKIGAGVWKECVTSYKAGKPTFILMGASKFFVRFDPENHHKRLELSIQETRDRIKKDIQ